ncbi:DUF2809 domain-containing protein [Lewinella cohaerens]|uniref:ribosomal maturation YjgA family protein n=1 Tax=Lewinella cohaerens TaxID=70995 RepID=UPI00047619F1|nr:DUF2809 domain-containing protein [Lewinella cohaerens]
MKRNRKLYLVLILTTVALGLLSRTSLVPKLIYPYLGDYLYALMVFFWVGFCLPRTETLKVAMISIIICYLIEFFQLYQADWINNIRNYRLGGLILGHGFLWSDIVSYTLGGWTGYGLEWYAYRRK